MDDAVTPRRPRALVVLLVVLLLVVAATSVVLLLDRRDAGGAAALPPADIGADGWTDGTAGQAVVAARTAATTYFTLDHRDVRADMDAMRRLGTPEFREDYDAGAAALVERITEQRLVLSAALPRDSTATESLATDRATVLVAVDVRTARPGADRTTRYRTRVALDLVDGEWLVSALDEVA